MNCTPYHSSHLSNSLFHKHLLQHFNFLQFLLSTHHNPFFHLSSIIFLHQYLIYINSFPSLLPQQALLPFLPIFHSCLYIKSSSFFFIKGSAIPWGSFVIVPRGLWVGGVREGRKEKEEKEAGSEQVCPVSVEKREL